jgi:hypothetical protein
MPHKLTGHEQDVLATLVQHMDNPLDEFDMDVGDHIERMVREGNYKKMQAAMRGGDLGPEQFEQEQVQQTGALQQQAGALGEQQAAQAQAAQTSVNAPPAPTGAAGVTTPYPAQAKPGAVPTTGKMPSQPPEAPEGEVPEQSE